MKNVKIPLTVTRAVRLFKALNARNTTIDFLLPEGLNNLSGTRTREEKYFLPLDLNNPAPAAGVVGAVRGEAVAALGSALAQAANVPDKTPLVRRLVAKANVRLLKEVGGGVATDEEFEAALEEIDRTDFAAPAALPDPFAALAGGVSQEEAERLYEEMMSK